MCIQKYRALRKALLNWIRTYAYLAKKGYCRSGGFRGGGALGASAPPAESMIKNLNLPFFLLSVR